MGEASLAESTLQSLREMVGAERILTGASAASHAVDGLPPHAVLLPERASQVAAILSYADSHGLSVIPWGGGTQMHLGNVPERVDLVLSLSHLDRLVAHEPADMTVTVEAGMTLHRLQEILAKSGQYLPIDPPLPSEATVGGILATRAFGPSRLGSRTISDWLLGIHVVTAQGELTKAGGRVVKNVSGYELGRLYAGSYGTLAVIVEATFKVQPLPKQQKALALPCIDLDAADRAIRSVRASNVQPSFLELIGPVPDPAAALATLLRSSRSLTFGGDGALLLMGFTGTAEEVDWQIETAEALLTVDVASANGSLTAPRATATSWDLVYRNVMAVHMSAPDPFKVVTFRAHVLTTQLCAFVDDATHALTAAGLEPRYAAHAGSGIVRFHVPAAGFDEGVLRTLQTSAKAADGYLIVESAPTALKRTIDVWGDPRPEFFLHQAVKERMDPHKTLNPGRFLGKI